MNPTQLANYQAEHFLWEVTGTIATITLNRPERKNPLKQRVTFLIAGPRGVGRQRLAEKIDEGIDGPLKGAVDWETG